MCWTTKEVLCFQLQQTVLWIHIYPTILQLYELKKELTSFKLKFELKQTPMLNIGNVDFTCLEMREYPTARSFRYSSSFLTAKRWASMSVQPWQMKVDDIVNPFYIINTRTQFKKNLPL